MVRHLIGDLSSTPTYTDSRIQDAIVIGGLLAAQDFTFSTTYTFDIDAPDITPDPVDTYDTLAMALFTLKAACILSTNQYQSVLTSSTSTGSKLKVQDGDSVVDIDNTSTLRGFTDIMKNGVCASYDKLLKDKEFKRSMGRGKAIVGPFSHENYSSSGSNLAIFDILR